MATPTYSSGKLQVDGSGATSHTFTLGTALTAGRDAVFKVVVFQSAGLITGVSMGGKAATLISRNTSDANNQPEIWLVQGMTSTTTSVVVTVAGGAYISGSVDEWGVGVLSASAVDTGTAANSQAGSGSPTVTTGTTSQASTIVYGVAVAITAISNNGFTNPSGWTNGFIEQDSNSHEAGIGSWIERTSAGTETFAPGMTSGAWAATAVALKLAGGGGGGGSAFIVNVY